MLHPWGWVLRPAGKGTGHRNPANQGLFVEGQGRNKGNYDKSDTRIDLRKERQPGKFKTEQLRFPVGGKEPSALLLRVMSLKVGLGDHYAIACVGGSRRGNSQGHEWGTRNASQQGHRRILRIICYVCSSVSSSAKWG